MKILFRKKIFTDLTQSNWGITKEISSG